MIGGELIITPSPVPYHQIVSGGIEFELRKFSSGIKEYWIVYPMEKSIEVYENLNGEFKIFD